MSKKPSNYGKLWSKEELILAFELYCRIPFQKTKANNPEVQKLARLLNRSPASIARKLGNFGAFDPKLKAQNISGLEHGSHLDKEIWDAFHNNWNVLVLQAHEVKSYLKKQNVTAQKSELNLPDGPSERVAIQKQRLHQTFFRTVVLCSYQYRCCITGINLKETLIASHIIPWSRNKQYRADPTNGLCMSATFDRLFDCGLMTISGDYKICFSDTVLLNTDLPTRDQIMSFQEKKIILPEKFWPSQKHLRWHRENVFRR